MNLADIQKLIYEKMTQLRYPVLDDYALYDAAEPPYVILSDLDFSEDNTKNTDGMVVKFTAHVFSTYQGKKEILDIVQEVGEVMNFTTKINDNIIYTKQGKTTVMGETSNQGLFVSDRKYDKFYHAVMIFKIYIK